MDNFLTKRCYTVKRGNLLIKNLCKMPVDQILYSERYSDDVYDYRHVILPPDIARLVPKSHLMSETEWRNLGVQQSPAWMHFMVHSPEPHVLLFRKPKELPTPTPALNEVETNGAISVSDP